MKPHHKRHKPAVKTSEPNNQPNATPATTAGQIARPEPDADAGKAQAKKIKAMHTPVLGQYIYRRQLNELAKEMDDMAMTYVAETLLRMKTRDPLEEMLVMQCIWTHTRLAGLSVMAAQQERRDNVQVVHAACDGAANTFRRQCSPWLNTANLVKAATRSRRSNKPTLPINNWCRMPKMENCQKENRQTNKDWDNPPRRRYRLTPTGLNALRQSARQNEPWKSSTGPRTAEGKTRSKFNAMKHGFRSAEVMAAQRESRAMMRMIRADRANENAAIAPILGTAAGDWMNRIEKEIQGIGKYWRQWIYWDGD